MPSPTVPTADQSESDVLDVRADIWQKRPLLRQIYHRYFAEMITHLAQLPDYQITRSPNRYGTILEIGGGSGNFKQYFNKHHPSEGRLITSDIIPTPHCDLAADATALPFPDNSLDNILMMDVLHHIPHPLKFFTEAQRTLRPAGRILMTEPYISPASRLIFKLAHPEPVDLHAEIFPYQQKKPAVCDGGANVHSLPQKLSEEQSPPDPSPLRGTGAFASNQATPTLLFYRDLPKFRTHFPNLKLILRTRRSLLLYPLSGGFSGPKLLPHSLAPLLWPLESLLQPLSPLLAFRLLIVLEKR